MQEKSPDFVQKFPPAFRSSLQNVESGGNGWYHPFFDLESDRK